MAACLEIGAFETPLGKEILRQPVIFAMSYLGHGNKRLHSQFCTVVEAELCRAHSTKQLHLGIASYENPKGGSVKRSRFGTLDQWAGKAMAATIALAISAAPTFAQNLIVNSGPASVPVAINPQLPKGAKIVASVPLEGLPVTRMYTQWEYGRTYLYIEHGGHQLTTVDVTKKQKPQVVNHEPGKVGPKRYEELADGGTIEVSPPWNVNAGIDNVGGRGMLSILASSDSDDVQLLQAFGRGSSNLADRDAHLIFFASPAQLLIVQDDRLSPSGY